MTNRIIVWEHGIRYHVHYDDRISIWFSTNTYHRGHNIYHRAHNLPALEWKNGSQEYYYEGKRHRTDGPAVIDYRTNVMRQWWVHGKLHRLDGPAVIGPDGKKSWFINNKPIDVTSDQEFARYLKFKLFL